MTHLSLPATPHTLSQLRAGQSLLLSGTLYTARDAAHRRMVEALTQGQPLPIPTDNTALFYVGACFDPDGHPIAAGPTTAQRMDVYTPPLLGAGVRVLIAKGDRSPAVYRALQDTHSVYLAAIGGAGALYAHCITRCDLVAYPDLGPEAIYRLEVQDFPVLVAIDTLGNSIYRH